MRTFFSVLILALFGFTLQTTTANADFAPSPDPSRIVLNPAADGSTGQIVSWRTDAATTTGSVQYEPAAGGPTVTVPGTASDPIDFGSWSGSGWTYISRHHTATLNGLSPATRYRYRAGKEGNWSDWFNFETAATDGRWEMIYFGDAQTNLDTHWGPVVDKAFAKSPNAKFALHAGDMINDPEKDHQFGQWFAGLGSHARTTNHFAVSGNHERFGDPGYRQYRSHFPNAGNGPESLKKTVYYVDYQDVRFVSLDGHFLGVDDQYEWLDEVLTDNPNKWSVVAIHEPILAGAKGRDHNYLRDPLMPIIKKHNVDLFLQGHDHVYARGMLNEDIDSATGYGDGPVFAVAVAGPKYYDLDPGEDNNWTQNGATRIVAHDQTSTYQPISFDGDVLTYRSYVASKGAGSTTDREVGDLLDAFTITKRKDGSKVVSEGETPPDLTPDPDPGPDTKPKPLRTTLKIRKVTRNRANGTAKVTLVASHPGQVTAGGKGSPIRRVSRRVKAGKPVTIQIRAAANRTRSLRRKGRLAVRVKVRFKPDTGSVREVSRRVTLIRKKR